MPCQQLDIPTRVKTRINCHPIDVNYLTNLLEVLDLGGVSILRKTENQMEAIRRDLQVKLEITWISLRNSVTTSTTGLEIVIRQKNFRINRINKTLTWVIYSKQRLI